MKAIFSWVKSIWESVTGVTVNSLVFLVALFATYLILAFFDIDGIEQVKVLNMLAKVGFWTGVCAFYAKFFATKSYDTERDIVSEPIAVAIVNGLYYLGAAIIIANA